MSVPVSRDGPRAMLPVIRVDMDMPYIDGGMQTVVKWARRASNSAVSGISFKVVAAKERVLNAIKDMNGVDNYGKRMFDVYAQAKTLGMKMDNILKTLRALIILVLPTAAGTLIEYQSSRPLESYSNEYLGLIRQETSKLWDTVVAHKSAKEDASWGQTLVALYNQFVELYISGHPQPAPPAGTAFVPMALYRPVLLRLP